jgi:hypothetical protein
MNTPHRDKYKQLFKQHIDKYKEIGDYDLYHSYILKLLEREANGKQSQERSRLRIQNL